jgi:sugar O-acyltransferase (sialic acid O-acetyltransferase NeuD family)
MKSMPKPIVIFGAGGFGREVLQILRDINRSVPGTWDPLGFIVDAGYATDLSVQGLPVLGSIEWLQQNKHVLVVISVGSPSARWRIVKRISGTCENSFATLVHPRAWLGDSVEIGCGSVICAGVLITTDVHIGEHVNINIGSTVGHDAVLDDFVTLNPSVNISGNVTLQPGVEVGTGSVLIPYAHVGSWVIIGAGSTVTKPLDDNVTAVGTPAKVIKVRPSGWHEG